MKDGEIMTQERKDQLYDQMIAWICEHHENDKDLFLVLTEHFGMTKEELHDHCIESLDSFFPAEEAEERETETVSESVHPVGISLNDFISEVSDMVSSDDKTAVLDWIEYASFMTDVDESGRRTLEGELREVYLPLCYVRNNFSNSVLQKSLDMDTLGNEIIYGAMMFAAGYYENEVRDMGNEGRMEDGYIPLSADEKGSLFVVAIAGRDNYLFIGNNMDGGTTIGCLKRAVQLAEMQGRDIASVLEHPATAGMPLRKITDARLIDAVKISCTASTAIDHIAVYDPAIEEIRLTTTEGLTTEQRDAFFCCGAPDQADGIIQQM